MDFKTFYEILFSILIGALLGMERERAGRGKILGGVRTFPLVSLIGYLSYYFSSILPYSFYISLLGIFGLSIISYNFYKAPTTAISFIIVFLLGGLVGVNLQLALILSVISLVILSFRKPIHKFTRAIRKEEWYDLIKFLILSFIIFPLLPEKPMDPWGIVKLKDIWKVVILISFLNFLGYLALKIFGKKGMVFSGIFGGMTSSTAVTLSISSLARKRKIEKIGAATVVAAISTMFIRIPIVSSFVSFNVFIKILPYCLFSSVIGFIISFLYYKMSEEKETGEITEIGSPFNVGDALKFGLLFGIVLILANFARMRYGNLGLYVISSISGVTDVDAINLSLSNMYEEGKIGITAAIFGIFLAFTVNNILKGIISFISNRNLGFLVFVGVFLMTLPFVLLVIFYA